MTWGVVAVGVAVFVGCGDDGEAASTTTSGAGASASGGAGAGAAATTGGDGAGGEAVGGRNAGCEACGRTTVLGALEVEALTETSGLASSTRFAGSWFGHNDSGDTARFFAFETSGAEQATFTLPGATAVDWEDMARGPCGEGRGACLYFGDFGDNEENRSDYVVYRVPEPASLGGGDVTFDELPFRYPDGSHNAETLLAHPLTGEIAVVTKVTGGAASIYAFPTPLTPGVEVTLVKTGEVKPPGLLALVTGGDVHPSGSRVLIRTYIGLWLYSGAANQTIAELLAHEPCEVPFASERQGEAVAWTADGVAYITVSEGAGSAVNAVSCGF